jgi:CRP-like cAMP-binding protein
VRQLGLGRNDGTRAPTDSPLSFLKEKKMPPAFTKEVAISWAKKVLEEGGGHSGLRTKLAESLFERLAETSIAFKAGQKIFEEGTAGDSVMFVLQGSVVEASEKDGWAGRTCRAGDSFGQWAATQGDTRPYDAIPSSSSVVVKELTRTVLEEIFQEVEGFQAVTERIALKLAENRLGSLTESILNEKAARNLHFLKHEGYLAKISGMSGSMKNLNGKLAKASPVSETGPGGKHVSLFC